MTECKKAICFILPAYSCIPVGGYKVVYEYANRLAADGFSVSIVYPRAPVKIKYSRTYFIYFAMRYLFSRFVRKLFGYDVGDEWFRLDSRISIFHVWGISGDRVPYADIYFATAVETAFYVCVGGRGGV
jgi:hypothetical protein